MRLHILMAREPNLSSFTIVAWQETYLFLAWHRLVMYPRLTIWRSTSVHAEEDAMFCGARRVQVRSSQTKEGKLHHLSPGIIQRRDPVAIS